MLGGSLVSHPLRCAVASRSEARPAIGMETFAAETLELLRRVLAADWVSMYLVNDAGSRVELASRGAPAHFLAAWWERETSGSDPFAAARQGVSSGELIGLRELVLGDPRRWASYLEFLGAFDIVDAAEMVFVHVDEVVGGIRLLWTARAHRTLTDDWATARDLQRYIHYNFLAAWHVAPIGRRRRIIRELRLTAREAQLVESLCSGRTNAELAEQLNITVSTVKSHLLHIFNKVGVDNRAALIEKALRLPGDISVRRDF